MAVVQVWTLDSLPKNMHRGAALMAGMAIGLLAHRMFYAPRPISVARVTPSFFFPNVFCNAQKMQHARDSIDVFAMSLHIAAIYDSPDPFFDLEIAKFYEYFVCGDELEERNVYNLYADTAFAIRFLAQNHRTWPWSFWTAWLWSCWFQVLLWHWLLHWAWHGYWWKASHGKSSAQPRLVGTGVSLAAKDNFQVDQTNPYKSFFSSTKLKSFCLKQLDHWSKPQVWCSSFGWPSWLPPFHRWKWAARSWKMWADCWWTKTQRKVPSAGPCSSLRPASWTAPCKGIRPVKSSCCCWDDFDKKKWRAVWTRSV